METELRGGSSPSSAVTPAFPGADDEHERRSRRCSNIKLRSILSAIVTRLVFTLHCCIALWRIALTIEWQTVYWALFSGLGCMFVESAITIGCRKGAEYKWFCPSVFFYLTTIVPSIWILELDQLEKRRSTVQLMGHQLASTSSYPNATNSTNDTNATQDPFQESASTQLMITSYTPTIGFFIQLDATVKDTLNFDPSMWIVAIEQLLLFLLILGRWLLPKGNISRDELSQLLLVYIGMAADIIEFFETFKEDTVRTDWNLTVIILSIWSASLLQFTLVLTASLSPENPPSTDKETTVSASKCCSCCSSEVFGMIIAVLLQDCPFLCLRLMLLIEYDVKSYMHLFFTVKNSLVLFIIIYRLYVLFQSRRSTNTH